MAESSKANTVPEGTTFVFGSWACTADESGGFIGHLISPKGPEAKLDDQPAGTADAPKLGGNQALPELDSENLENMSTPTRANGSIESNVNPRCNIMEGVVILHETIHKLHTKKKTKWCSSQN